MTVRTNPQTAEPVTERFADRGELARAVAEKLVAVLREAVRIDGVAHVGLTGGGAGIATLEAVAELLRSGATESPDWTKIHLWWGDERLLPVDDSERNAQQAGKALTEYLVAEQDLPAQNIHQMPTSEEAADTAAAAEMYAEELHAHTDGEREGLAVPAFAVILLGVGPDGHIASLFPGKESLAVTGRTTVGEEDAPKPPPPRVSLTFDAIHTAERVWTVVTGRDKAAAAAQALDAETAVEMIPAKNARGRLETVWHLDEEAGSRL